jgi:hypothetical protein
VAYSDECNFWFHLNNDIIKFISDIWAEIDYDFYNIWEKK